ncbi:MAG: DUF763 domain-containing protein [Candidatus Nitrosocaldaceae archaeon]
MIKKGVMQLPLHDGKAPPWLTKRMKELARCISRIIIDEYGSQTILERLSDPLWFQAFGCVLGYDWHSSGVTTVVTGVLKQVMDEQVMIAGGKGKKSRDTPYEIEDICNKFNISESKKNEMIYASRITAKVDNVLLQDNYKLYHHAFVISEDGSWAVIQQGMDELSKTARRYHWLSTILKDFVNEPRSGIISSDVRENVLDLTSCNSEECRKVCVDIANDNPNNTISSIYKLRDDTLDRWLYGTEAYGMPRRLDWDIFKKIYDIHPRNYEELIAIKGVGSNTIRALALIAEIIYGSKVSWRDPVKFTFAHGGKDGIPYPVDRELYDKNISILKDAIEASEIDRKNKLNAIRRLRVFYD